MANTAEKAFVAFAGRRFKVSRHGWPDFFVQRRATKKFLCVEVKQGLNRISPAQRVMFSALEAAGIEVVVWNPSQPRRLSPWRNYDPKPLLRRRHSKKAQTKTALVRITREERLQIARIAARRGHPHTSASVAGELISIGLKEP